VYPDVRFTVHILRTDQPYLLRVVAALDFSSTFIVVVVVAVFGIMPQKGFPATQLDELR
jgi:hypothetical protein